MAGKLVDRDSEIGRFERPFYAVEPRPDIAGLPPRRGPGQQVVRQHPCGIKFRRVREFLVAAEDHDGLPLLATEDLLDFDTDQRVGTHPLNLPTNGCEGIEMLREGEGNDIGLSAPGTAQMPDMHALQQIQAHVAGHVSDQHMNSPVVIDHVLAGGLRYAG